MAKALITGAGVRLGRAMALYLAGRGHDIAVHYATSADAAEEVAAEARAMGVAAVALMADLLGRGRDGGAGPARGRGTGRSADGSGEQRVDLRA